MQKLLNWDQIIFFLIKLFHMYNKLYIDLTLAFFSFFFLTSLRQLSYLLTWQHLKAPPGPKLGPVVMWLAECTVTPPKMWASKTLSLK